MRGAITIAIVMIVALPAAGEPYPGAALDQWVAALGCRAMQPPEVRAACYGEAARRFNRGEPPPQSGRQPG